MKVALGLLTTHRRFASRFTKIVSLDFVSYFASNPFQFCKKIKLCFTSFKLLLQNYYILIFVKEQDPGYGTMF